MSKQRHISHSCRIKDHQVYLNDKLLHKEGKSLNFKDFSKGIYKKADHKYPKFFKMDNLSKLAYLCAEYLLKGQALLEHYAAEDVAVVLDCKMSSLETDIAYQASMNEIPSPGLFVYTLPNIMIGEICIRHKIKGENACFVSERFDSKQQLQYLDSLLDSGAASICLAGNVDYFEGKYMAELYLYN